MSEDARTTVYDSDRAKIVGRIPDVALGVPVSKVREVANQRLQRSAYSGALGASLQRAVKLDLTDPVAHFQSAEFQSDIYSVATEGAQSGYSLVTLCELADRVARERLAGIVESLGESSSALDEATEDATPHTETIGTGPTPRGVPLKHIPGLAATLDARSHAPAGVELGL